MTTKNLVLGSMMAGMMLFGSLGMGQKMQMPKDNISGKLHPNLAAAQRLSTEAFEKVMAAQRANEWDMGGHAQKAKELLDEVNRELKMAAEDANRDRK